ncbi:hypothetical protein BDQ17DRAFT_684215 [Cyathus striatus]|nr:hypothetical protein BDQ17DRAFT_684215 [Cyathus striatus]
MMHKTLLLKTITTYRKRKDFSEHNFSANIMTTKMNKYETDLLQEIDERIDSCRNALIDLPEGSDGYLDTLEKIGKLHMDRFKLLSDSHQDRNEAIDIYREFCRLCSNSERRLSMLHQFAGILQERGTFSEGKVFTASIYRTAVDDFDEALSVEREAISICELDNNLYGHILGRMGTLLLSTSRLPDKREGIETLRLAVQAWPSGNLNKLEYLNKLAGGLYRLIVK